MKFEYITGKEVEQFGFVNHSMKSILLMHQGDRGLT